MPRRAGWRVCSRPGCGEFTDQGGRCPDCRAAAEKKRGTARQRGYSREHEQRFRPGVLAVHPMCVLCGQRPSVHADHHPLSRRQLIERGLDPNDPRYGRGLCQPCHSRETAQHQPGGWNQ
jgi:5-methylcytosine-specific restriction protein A